MSTGLQEFLDTSEEKVRKQQATFLLLTGRIAAGEDVPAKTISTVVAAAGKSLPELTAEIEVATNLHAAAAAIEASRAVILSAGPRIERQAALMVQIDAEEAAICERIVALELMRFDLQRAIGAISRDLATAADTDRTARKMIAADDGRHGINVPEVLPVRPLLPHRIQVTTTRKSFDELCRLRVQGAIDIRRKRPLGDHDEPLDEPSPVSPPVSVSPSDTPVKPVPAANEATTPIPLVAPANDIGDESPMNPDSL